MGKIGPFPWGTGPPRGRLIQPFGSKPSKTLNPARRTAVSGVWREISKPFFYSSLRDFFELPREWHPTCLTKGRQLARVSVIPPTLVFPESKGGVAGTES